METASDHLGSSPQTCLCLYLLVFIFAKNDCAGMTARNCRLSSGSHDGHPLAPAGVSASSDYRITRARPAVPFLSLLSFLF